ncbi:MAG: alpha/beta hydrolase fold domain-containing protein [Planctomycetes bacterium]|nr:alpha/beta hydrolase fold domain-containing protein [Planctomycetota bacterium]
MRFCTLAMTFALALHVSSLTAQTTEPERIPFKETKDARGNAVTLHLHVFKPNGWTPEDRRPAVVYFFGGGWSQGTPTAFYPESQMLVQRGLVALCAEYRVKRREGTTPQDCVADAKSAMRYVRLHAKELGIDPLRIAAGGGSAGGHLALATALVDGFDEPGEATETSCEPNLLLLYNPVLDTSAPDGWGTNRLGDDAVAMSPMDHLRADQPPSLLVHGTADRTVPIETARRFRDGSTQHGASCTLYEYEGAEHGFFHPVDREDLSAAANTTFLDITRKTFHFLGQHGFFELREQQATYLAPLADELRKTWPANRTVNIVCHGHSVPAGYARTPIIRKVDSYPFLLHVGLCERYPHAPINVITTAIGGETSEAGAQRFERDVLSHRPDLITIDYALNDRRIGLERAETSWRSMIEMAQSRCIPVLLLTPTGDTRADMHDPHDALSRHAALIRGLACEYGVGLVDSLAAFQKHVDDGGQLEDLMSQVNHPNRKGHELVAKKLMGWFPE